ncbi:MAG: hypothetical protein JO078_05680 [Candidatus Eremiobacteraeota bacterium]|nr:hypothetical protein [Candidatus Eremiobacteraeota bacterium]
MLSVIILVGCSRMPASSLPATSQTSQPTPSSSNFQTLHIFSKLQNGIVPVGTLLDLSGRFYGTTNFGGDAGKGCTPGPGCGTIFDFNSVKQKVFYRFTGPASGARPYAGLIDVNGTLYGTTQIGGHKNLGAVFAITTSGSEKMIYSFSGKDGNDPRANLTSVNDALYGTTYYGGKGGTGTVFAVSTSGAEKVLHSFKGGADGALPLGALIDVNNVLYGTTSSGGTSNDGTVFEISPTGAGYSVLYNFKGGTDGAYPFAGLTAWKGALYGTTQQGGEHNKGTVFVITTAGSERVLHSFGGKMDGTKPFAGITPAKGKLYGTTAYGGSKNDGTIYTITPSGAEQVLHDFTGAPNGRVPYANLTAVRGILYGTTVWGGVGGAGLGTVFKFTP